MNRLILLALCALSGSLGLVSASSPTLVDKQKEATAKSTKLIFIDSKPDSASYDQYVDSVQRKISDFYYDQFRHFQDPQAPYFLFLSKDSQLAMGIGGNVRLRAYYDWGGAIPSSGFAPYLIPIPEDPTCKRHFGTSPSGTALFFRVIGQNKSLGDYQLYIEANFNGYEARDFRLKKAYAIIRDFTIGYATSTFADPAAESPILDAQGANGKISPTSALVRWMPTIKDKWVFAVSAETPATEVADDGVHTKKVSEWMPDFAAFVQYQWAKGQHVRLAGIVRTLSYRDLDTDKNHNPLGYGVLLGTVGNPHPALTLYGECSYGKGCEGLDGDLSIGNYDLVADPARPGVLYAPKSFGWSVGVQYNFRPNLFASVTASQQRYLPAHQVSPDEYKYGIFACANIFWNPTPRIQLGAEFDLGKRQNFSGAHRYARRIGLLAQMSF